MFQFQMFQNKVEKLKKFSKKSKKYFVKFFHNYFKNESDDQDDDHDLISVRLKLVNGSISSGTIILAGR